MIAIVLRGLLTTEPSYHGVSLGKWLVRLSQEDAEAEIAIRQIGTNAIPQLLKELTATESHTSKEVKLWVIQNDLLNITNRFALNRRLMAVQAFRVLGDVAIPALPKLGELMRRRESSRFASLAVAGLGLDGVPTLTNGLSNPDPVIRRNAAMAFGTLGVVPTFGIQALIGALSDEDSLVQWAAVVSLGTLHREPARVIPSLIGILAHTNRVVRHAVLEALGNWGPEAEIAAPAIRAFSSDTDRLLRSTAINALLQIEQYQTNFAPLP